MSEQNMNIVHDAPSKMNQPVKSKRKLLWLMVILMFMLAWLIWFWFFSAKPHQPEEFSQWAQPVPVRVVPLSRADLQVELKAVGSAIPTQTVLVQSQVTGILKAIYFKEGEQVKKGQLLAQIDPAPLDVALAQAQGSQQQYVAQLQHAEAELQRKQQMLKQDAISRQEVDQQLALLNQLKGQTKALQAQVDAAKLQQSYSRIYAPISGQVGFRKKDIGNLIQANDSTGLVSITQTTPIYVEFALAENHLDVIRSSLQQQKKLTVEAWDRQEQHILAQGELVAVDNSIDASTATLKLKALFANQDHQLFANQFVNVRLKAQSLNDVVTVPTDAIQHGAKGTYVYIVDAQNKAQLRMLQLGISSDGKTQVLSGLEGNEKVVLEGIDRLSEGKSVQILTENRKTVVKGQIAQQGH